MEELQELENNLQGFNNEIVEYVTAVYNGFNEMFNKLVGDDKQDVMELLRNAIYYSYLLGEKEGQVNMIKDIVKKKD